MSKISVRLSAFESNESHCYRMYVEEKDMRWVTDILKDVCEVFEGNYEKKFGKRQPLLDEIEREKE
ncbi:MAG: hypothetical protein F4X82_01795 [Candidatus Spechtbacteria bacterium SB0662_bin_43]|uniref:Uncharacterized protein n=1 Tax=Candidatus Spechtbacteria bacterium SB0662_bin_43 TaxID=2604897 RepID=A0A845DA10_9BACT|nr:hypothetical protein [Candidatus Spechtbacteria bacterium SB0662_bin_43]